MPWPEGNWKFGRTAERWYLFQAFSSYIWRMLRIGELQIKGRNLAGGSNTCAWHHLEGVIWNFRTRYDKLTTWLWTGDCSRLTLKFRHIQTTGGGIVIRIAFWQLFGRHSFPDDCQDDCMDDSCEAWVPWNPLPRQRHVCINNAFPLATSPTGVQTIDLQMQSKICCILALWCFKAKIEHQRSSKINVIPSYSKSPSFNKLPLHLDPEHPAGSRGQLSQQYLKLLQQHLRLLKVWKHWLIDHVGSTWTVGRQRIKKRDVLSSELCVLATQKHAKAT